MLKLFGRLEKTRNIFIVGFIVLVAASMVAFPVYNRMTGGPARANAEDVLAVVGSDEITVGELETLKQQYAQMFGGQINMAALGGDRRFLDGLIRDRLIAQEAKRLGLAASDAEVAAEIRKRFSDASGKFIGVEEYKKRAAERFGSIERYEKQIRDQITSEKLQAFVTAGVTVSPDEVLDQFKRKDTRFDIVYVPITSAKLAEKIQPSDADLAGYYEQHKTEYRYLEPQKKIRYLFIEQAKVGEKLSVSDEDLKAEYDKLKPENKVAGVKVQQIVLKVVRPDLDPIVRKKAEDLLTQIRATGVSVPEDKFAEFARGNSEDPATAKQGGMLARPYRKDPNKANALYDRMTDLVPGTVTDAIKYGGNYYIMRRGEEVPKSFEDAKPELRVSLQNRRAYSVASQLAQRAAEKLKASKDFQAVAKELAAEANMKPEDMVRETGYVKPDDNVPNIGNSQQFQDGIAPLNNPNDVGERTPITGGFAIPMLLDKKEPRIPDFEEVKDRVRDAYKQEQARQRVEQTARDLASGTATANDLKAAAEKLGLEAKQEPAFKIGSPMAEVGQETPVDEVLYGLQAGEVSKTPVKVGDTWVVIGATTRSQPNLEEFGKQRDQLTQQAISTRRSQVFDDYINAIQARMQREGRIKIYEDVLARMADADAAAAPVPQQQQRPRIPIPTK